MKFVFQLILFCFSPLTASAGQLIDYFETSGEAEITKRAAQVFPLNKANRDKQLLRDLQVDAYMTCPTARDCL